MENATDTHREVFQFIDGEWRPGSGKEVIQVLNPATEKVAAQFVSANKADLSCAADASLSGFETWRSVPAIERASKLRNIATALRSNSERLARVLTEENGKTLKEAEAEVGWAAEYFEWYAEEARRLYGRTIPSRLGRDQLQYVDHEPIGPVLALAPWNWPLVTVARKVAPALAAGCSVVIKPAEEAPSIAVELVKLMLEAGIPSRAVNLVLGDPAAISEFLIQHPVIKKISFTGSVPVGRQLAELAGRNLKRITLELGGHAPVIILDDVDVSEVVDKIIPIKFRTAGQVCSCPSRFYVHEAIADEFERVLIGKTQLLNVGNGLQDGISMGPLISERRLKAVESLVKDAVDQGARVGTGGSPIDAPGYFFPPTVLTDVPDTAEIMSVEPFGPVVPISRFKDVEDVLERANSVSVGLAAYVFTNRMDVARHLSTRLRAGNVGVNTLGVSLAEAPFGGIGDTGDGREGGTEGIQSYLTTKLTVEAS